MTDVDTNTRDIYRIDKRLKRATPNKPVANLEDIGLDEENGDVYSDGNRLRVRSRPTTEVDKVTIYPPIKEIMQGGDNVTITPDDSNRTLTVASEVGDNEVTTDKVADNAITDAKLSQEVRDSIADAGGEVADGSIDTDKLADGAVTTSKLANDAVTGRKIAGNSVASGHLVNSAIINETRLENNSVTTGKIRADSVERGHMRDDSVGTTELVDGNVTEAKLDSDVQAKLLPTLPAQGSRDNKVPKFNGDTLGWEVDASGGGGGSARSFGSGSGEIAEWAEGDNTDRLPKTKLPTDTAYDADVASADDLAAANLDRQTVIEISPPFVAGETGARNLNVSIRHPLNAYSDATLFSVSVSGSPPVYVGYDHTVLEQSVRAEIPSTTINSSGIQNRLTEGNFIDVHIRLVTGRGATGDDVKFLRTVDVPVVAASSGGTSLTDAQIGDKAFSNPPNDLSSSEEVAVRQAIEATKVHYSTIDANPAQNLGAIGDMYIRNTSGRIRIYEKTASNVWTQRVDRGSIPTSSAIAVTATRIAAERFTDDEKRKLAGIGRILSPPVTFAVRTAYTVGTLVIHSGHLYYVATAVAATNTDAPTDGTTWILLSTDPTPTATQTRQGTVELSTADEMSSGSTSTVPTAAVAKTYIDSGLINQASPSQRFTIWVDDEGNLPESGRSANTLYFTT